MRLGGSIRIQDDDEDEVERDGGIGMKFDFIGGSLVRRPPNRESTSRTDLQMSNCIFIID